MYHSLVPNAFAWYYATIRVELNTNKTKRMNDMSRIKTYVTAGALAASSLAGLAVAPIVSAATTGSTSLEAAVGYTISLDSVSPSTTTLSVAPVVGGSQTTDSTAVTVTTNDSAGYTLSHYTSSATLVNGANTIASTSGTWASPIALANNTWGYAVASGTTGLTPGGNGFDASYSASSNQTTNTSKFAAMPTSSTAVRATSAAATSDVTTFWFSAKVDNTKPSGTYSTTINYSVVGN